jgi:uncharacterized membrane protein
VYQIRVAEALTVLPFLTRAAVPGLFVGCLLANIFGGLGWQDIVFGSLLTLVAAVLTRATYHLSRSRLKWPVVAAPIVAVWLGGLILLNQDELSWPVLIGCLASIPFGAIAVRWWLKPAASRAMAVGSGVISLAWLVAGLTQSPWSVESLWVPVAGTAVLITAWILTLLLTWWWVRGDNPNMLLAPLPPVLINAFGVPLYLAPMFGLGYWFSVQMVGVGQLIACYLLGLPLLRFLQKRESLLPLLRAR